MLEQTPLLRWRWRVAQGLAPADERSRAGDDFAARVYVTFVFEPERADLLERARRRVASALYGEVMPGTSLTYVWASREPRGAEWPNPFAASARMIVATSAAPPPSAWVDVEVDLLADYQRAFGRPAPAALFLALMTDSDNRCLRARASYAGFRLAPRQGAGR